MNMRQAKKIMVGILDWRRSLIGSQVKIPAADRLSHFETVGAFILGADADLSFV
jgi:hypothetical protein